MAVIRCDTQARRTQEVARQIRGSIGEMTESVETGVESDRGTEAVAAPLS